ncbi:amidase family protein [Streptomyces sp. NPDC006668]|uniref:amidase family protein n=1 Tax=Streptomyces sp. NPDC006668 TaxID=3156903 RepID=UPI0033DD8F47
MLGEQALAAADQADSAVARGDDLGPPHGVPFTIKDSLDTAGVVTTRGSRLFTDHVPAADATAVMRCAPRVPSRSPREPAGVLVLDGDGQPPCGTQSA